MQDELRMLADEIRACTACPLHRSARQAVPGEGSGESGIFFLGEAPGYNEDLQGRPFVGAAGQLLDELLSDIGLDRSKVFITNVVRHRPPENRDPLPEEVIACDIWLKRHLEVLKPQRHRDARPARDGDGSCPVNRSRGSTAARARSTD